MLCKDAIIHLRARLIDQPDACSYVVLESVAMRHCLRLDDPPADLKMDAQVALFNIQVVAEDSMFRVVRLPSTRMVPLDSIPRFDAFIEPCCGMGAMSVCAEALGLTSLAAMDISPLAVQTYQMNHSTGALVGNLLDGHDLGRFCELAHGSRCGVLTGFPCPPFSSMGDQKGFEDARSEVFVQILGLIYLFGASFAVLECTSETGKWALVNTYIDEIATTMGFYVTKGVLHLGRSWPCTRTRWWCVLSPVPLQPSGQPLRDLPWIPELQAVIEVIPSWPTWDSRELRALDWMDWEHQSYAKYIDPDDVLLNVNGSCPTILHSAGHRFLPCPCGCRSGPLSQHRFSRDGITTVALRSSTIENGFRHLHPKEAGFLCSVPADFRYPEFDLRAGLPLVGQLAAPLQTQWVVLQLLEALDKGNYHFGDKTWASIEEQHHQFIHELLRVRFHA